MAYKVLAINSNGVPTYCTCPLKNSVIRLGKM